MALRSLGEDRVNADRLLAARCVAGDRGAQRELFHAHRKRVHATLYRILGSNAPMDDLLQEVFLNVFRSLGSFRGDASLATWVDRLAVRGAFAYIGQRRVRPPHLELAQDHGSDEPSAERRALAREAARRLYAILDGFEPKLRVAFTLHAIDGRPLQEVAKLMESTLVATKTRVWRARRALEARAKKDPTLAHFVIDVGNDGDGRDGEEGEAS